MDERVLETIRRDARSEGYVAGFAEGREAGRRETLEALREGWAAAGLAPELLARVLAEHASPGTGGQES